MAILAVTLLSGPEAPVQASVPAAARDAGQPAEKPKETARVTSRTSDFDGKAGVILFEGDVVVRYSRDFTMCADRLYMFLTGTNELNRVVAVGNVSITNESRVGTCALATYRRKRGEIEMFCGGADDLAVLSDGERGSRSSLSGTDIRFWLDSERVEVKNSRITSEGKGGGRKLL